MAAYSLKVWKHGMVINAELVKDFDDVKLFVSGNLVAIYMFLDSRIGCESDKFS